MAKLISPERIKDHLVHLTFKCQDRHARTTSLFHLLNDLKRFHLISKLIRHVTCSSEI